MAGRRTLCGASQADLRRFRGQVTKPLASVTLTDLQDFADTLSALKGSTRYRILSAVKSLLAFDHRTGYLAFDVGRVPKLAAVHDNLAQRIPPEADVHRMLSLEPNERNCILLTLFYASGPRVSEICALSGNNLQRTAEGGQITVLGKVWKQLLKLRGKAGPAEPVFRPRKLGSFLRPPAVYRIVRRAPKRADEGRISPHWLRHAHAGPWRSHPPGASGTRPREPGHYQPLSTRPAERKLEPVSSVVFEEAESSVRLNASRVAKAESPRLAAR
jgi:integrase/recombinase XerD